MAAPPTTATFTLLPTAAHDASLLNRSEKPTALRSIFEDALVNRDAARGFGFTLAAVGPVGGNPPDAAQERSAEREGATETRRGRAEVDAPAAVPGRPLWQVVAEAQAEVDRRWPTPPGAAFCRGRLAAREWKDSREELRFEARRAARAAARRGVGRRSDLAKLVRAARAGDE